MTRKDTKDDIQQRFARIAKRKSEASEKKSNEIINDLSASVEDLMKCVESLDSELEGFHKKTDEIRKEGLGLIAKDSLYIVVLGVIVCGVVLLVAYGWAQTPEVSIVFDVGNVIGSVLVGIAALVAGVTYARKDKDDHSGG